MPWTHLRTAVSHQYDADGNLTRVTYPDGAAFSYVYNGLDQLTYLQEAASGDVLAQYAYDSYARPTTRTTPGNATATVSYDDVSRLANGRLI